MRFFVPAFLLTAAAIGQAETPTERGKRVIDDAIKALGGDKFLTMQDRIESGRAYSFYREQLSGFSRATIYTRYLTRPEPPEPGFHGQRERQAFGKDEDSAVLFTDEGGYEVTFRGARPLPDEIADRYRETMFRNIFYILRQRIGEPGLSIESKGSEVIENQPVEVVDIIDSDNRTVTVHFSSSTKLPVSQLTVRRDPVRNIPIEEFTRFSKYRAVSGIMWPFQINRERDGEKIYEIFSESVMINQNLTDNIFMLPSNVKILKKK